MFACCGWRVRRLRVGVIARVRGSAAAGSCRSTVLATTAATATTTSTTASATSLTAFTPLRVSGSFRTFRASGLLFRARLLALRLLLLRVGLLLRPVR